MKIFLLFPVFFFFLVVGKGLRERRMNLELTRRCDASLLYLSLPPSVLKLYFAEFLRASAVYLDWRKISLYKPDRIFELLYCQISLLFFMFGI